MPAQVCRTGGVSRRLTASAPASLPLPGAADTSRSAALEDQERPVLGSLSRKCLSLSLQEVWYATPSPASAHASYATTLAPERSGGVAGLTAWQLGWRRLRTAAAQPREPRGQMTWAIQANMAPTWFDPAETPQTVLY